jgi:hypothetical protein
MLLSEIGWNMTPKHSVKLFVVCLPVEFTVISSSCLVLQPTQRSFSCLLLLSVLEIVLASLFVSLFVFLFFVQPTMSIVYTKFGEVRFMSVVLPGFAWLYLYYYCLAHLFLVLKHSSVSIYNAALHGPASLLCTRDGRTDGRMMVARLRSPFRGGESSWFLYSSMDIFVPASVVLSVIPEYTCACVHLDITRTIFVYFWPDASP